MKKEAISLTVKRPPIFTLQTFKDDNGNYFVEVNRDNGAFWSGTYSVITEAISEALNRLRKDLPLEIL